MNIVHSLNTLVLTADPDLCKGFNPGRILAACIFSAGELKAGIKGGRFLVGGTGMF